MRQMVLNHVSIGAYSHHFTPEWTRDLAVGMKTLIQNNVSSMRRGLAMNEKGCNEYYSILHQVKMRGWKPEIRDEIEFLLSLSSKVPLLKEADDDLKDRVSRCEEKKLSPDDGEPLLFCALTNGIAAGLPSEDVWDTDRVIVRFDELLPDGSIEEAAETIDNLTRLVHASRILQRHIETLQRAKSYEVLWSAREVAFPRLRFLPEVKGQLRNLNSVAFTKVVTALVRLNDGNFSNVKGLGSGIAEYRMNFGPGYRIYFGEERQKLIVLVCGTKKSQKADVQVALHLWQDYKKGNHAWNE